MPFSSMALQHECIDINKSWVVNVLASSLACVVVLTLARLQSIPGNVCRYMQQVGVADQMPMQDGSLLQHTDMQRV